MTEHYNPFKENRTEQMKDLWKYYVPFSGLDSAGKPIIVEGGRGSGKTMFFQCNSWRQVILQIRKRKNHLLTSWILKILSVFITVSIQHLFHQCEEKKKKIGDLFLRLILASAF